MKLTVAAMATLVLLVGCGRDLEDHPKPYRSCYQTGVEVLAMGEVNAIAFDQSCEGVRVYAYDQSHIRAWVPRGQLYDAALGCVTDCAINRVVWLHGETDAQWGVDYYEEWLVKIVAALREDFGSGLEVVLVQTMTGAAGDSDIRNAKLAVAAADPLVFIVESADLDRLGDGITMTHDARQILCARIGGV